MNKNLGAGILMLDIRNRKVLLAFRTANCSFPNTWAIFGGSYDSNDESIRKTAIRELKEEYNINQSFKISKKPLYVYEDDNVKFYTFLGITDKELKINLKLNENSKYNWFDLNKLPENLMKPVQIMFENSISKLKKYL